LKLGVPSANFPAVELSRAAGEALGAVRGSSLADAVVMASTALRGGGVVYTAEVDDLTRLTRYFPTVLVLPCLSCACAHRGSVDIPAKGTIVVLGSSRARRLAGLPGRDRGEREEGLALRVS